MSRGLHVHIGDGRFHGRYPRMLVEKFNAFVNGVPFHEEPPNGRVITSHAIRHLDTVEKLRDALFMYAYNGQKSANRDHEENKRFYNILLRVGGLAGVAGVFGAFADLSPQALGVAGLFSACAIFGTLYSKYLSNDVIKEFKRLADNVNEVYSEWKKKGVSEETV